MTSIENGQVTMSEKEDKPLSPLMQNCEEITEDLRSLLRDLQDMKKRRQLLESHML